MPLYPGDAVPQSPFIERAELALRDLKQRVMTHLDRESHLRSMYAEWQTTWLSRADELRQQIAELEARLAPWIPRDDSLRLAVVSRSDDAA
jgi:BMFP domain-containing protein YqiC